MKKIYFWMLLFLMSGGFVFAADPAAYVPACADAAIFLRIARLKQIPVLTRLAKSGEVSRLEKPLRELSVKPEVLVAAFTGLNERLVLAEAPSPETLYSKLQKAYAKKNNFQIKLHSIAGMPAVTKIFFEQPGELHSYYDAVWLTDSIAAFGNEDYPLPEQKLLPADGKYRGLSVQGNLAAAYIPDPSRFGFDVMGLAQQLRNIRLTARESEKNIILSGSAEARDAQFLKQTAQMFSGAVRILLVSFFGDDEELCQTLIRKLQISTGSGFITFHADLDEKTLLEIQRYYDKHTAQIQEVLKNNVRKTN